MNELSEFAASISSAIEQLLDHAAKQNQEISDLKVKCAWLENILFHIVVKSISERDQEIYSTIQKIASDMLSLIPEEHKTDELAEKLKSILNIRDQVMPKPVLRLVKSPTTSVVSSD